MRNRARQIRRAMTEAERRVWSAIRRDQCDGYRADFYCPALKLVLEIDGQSHDSMEAQRYDANRTESLGEARGLRVIRLHNLFVLQATPEQIRQAIRTAIAKPK